MKLIIRLVFALLGALAAAQVAAQAGMSHHFDVCQHVGSLGRRRRRWRVLGWLVAFFLGGIAIKGIRRIEAAAQKRSAGELVVGGVGLLLGLGVGALATLAIGALPYVGDYLLLPLFLVLGYVFARVAARQHRQILRLVGSRRRGQPAEQRPGVTPQAPRPPIERRRACWSTPRRSSTAASPT